MIRATPLIRLVQLPHALWLCALWLASRVGIFLWLAGRGSDLVIYKGYWTPTLAGHVAYRDFFPEYPPLALFFTGIPVIFDRSLDWYFPLFRLICFAVDCGIWISLLSFNRSRPIQNLMYIAGTTALGALIYDRIDLALGGLLVAAMIFMQNGRRSRFHLSLGLAIAFKLIPIIWAPIALASEYRASNRRLIRAVLLLCLPALIFCDIAILQGGFTFNRLLEYHAQRGIQLESMPASIEMILLQQGASGSVYVGYGSANLHTDYEQLLIRASTALLAISVMLATAIAFTRRITPNALSLLLCAVLSASLLFSKVLSPQYFIFLLCALVTAPLPSGRLATAAYSLLLAVIFGATAILFPWGYEDLMWLRPWAVTLVIVRNASLGILTIALFYRAWKSTSAQEDLPLLSLSPRFTEQLDAGVGMAGLDQAFGISKTISSASAAAGSAPAKVVQSC